MVKDKLVRRIILYLIGFAILAAGISLSIKANLGISPVSSIPYNLEILFGIEMGKATVFFYCLLVVIQIIILKKKFKIINFLQILSSIIFGYFTTVSNSILLEIIPNPTNITMQVVMFGISIILIAIGVYLYVFANLIPLAAEGVVMALAEMTNKQFSTLKIIVDASFVAIALLMSLSMNKGLGAVGIGTIISAFGVGFVIKIVSKVFENITKYFI